MAKKFEFAPLDCKDTAIIDIIMNPTVHNLKIMRQASNEYLLKLKELQVSIENKYLPLLNNNETGLDYDAYIEARDTVDEELPSPPGTDNLWYS